MKTSESIESLSISLISLQGELLNIGKDSKGYGYNYTSLEKLLEYIRPLMAKHNLGFIQTPTNNENRIGVTTRLIHKSGEFIEDTLLMDKSNLAKMNDYQVAGSIITYFRRYAVSSILGIASDEDVDANLPPQEKPQVQQNKIKLISEDQVEKLESLILKKQADKAALMEHFDVVRLSELSEIKYHNAMAMLNKKKDAKKEEVK